jgi:hypothetical protein
VKTYWHGRECPARRVLVVAGGAILRAVELVTPDEGVLYFNDDDGAAWQVVTVGLGAVCFRMDRLSIERVVSEPPDGECPRRVCATKECSACASS